MRTYIGPCFESLSRFRLDGARCSRGVGGGRGTCAGCRADQQELVIQGPVRRRKGGPGRDPRERLEAGEWLAAVHAQDRHRQANIQPGERLRCRRLGSQGIDGYQRHPFDKPEAAGARLRVHPVLRRRWLAHSRRLQARERQAAQGHCKAEHDQGEHNPRAPSRSQSARSSSVHRSTASPSSSGATATHPAAGISTSHRTRASTPTAPDKRVRAGRCQCKYQAPGLWRYTRSAGWLRAGAPCSTLPGAAADDRPRPL